MSSGGGPCSWPMGVGEKKRVVEELLSRLPENSMAAVSVLTRLDLPSGAAVAELMTYDGPGPSATGLSICLVDAIIVLEKTRLEIKDQVDRGGADVPIDFKAVIPHALQLEYELLRCLLIASRIDQLMTSNRPEKKKRKER